MKFLHTETVPTAKTMWLCLPELLCREGNKVTDPYRRSAEYPPHNETRYLLYKIIKLFQMDLKNQVGSMPTVMGRNDDSWMMTYDTSRRLTFLQGCQVCESHYLVGEGKERVTNNLISFPIQHAKTHTSATMRSPQQLLPEQKAGSSFNAPKTKHIIL